MSDVIKNMLSAGRLTCVLLALGYSVAAVVTMIQERDRSRTFFLKGLGYLTADLILKQIQTAPFWN